MSLIQLTVQLREVLAINEVQDKMKLIVKTITIQTIDRNQIYLLSKEEALEIKTYKN
jgi:hypothetical protein